MNRQDGFTLIELVIALALFALLSLGCWRLFDGLLRVEDQVGGHERSLRELQRAIALIERDVLQLAPRRDGQGLVLRQGQLNLHRGNWRNPLDQPRSERQEIGYRLEQGSLWRYSRSLELEPAHKQRLLEGVRSLEWRVHDRQSGWRNDWPGATGPGLGGARALEIRLSSERFERIRRVIMLPEGP